MEKLNVTKICNGVGWDEKSYFCWNCGKAGFSSLKKAIGHQAQCPAKVKNLGASLTNRPTDQPTTDKPEATTLPAHRPYTIRLPKPEIKIPALNNELQLAGLVQDIAGVKQELAKFTNEGFHLQAVQQTGFLGISREGWIIIAVVGLLAYYVGRESSCVCSSNGSSRRSNTNIGDRVKDKAISYGLSKLFK